MLELANLPTNFFANRMVDFDYTILDSCAGLVQFTANLKIPATFITWDFGDGTTSWQINPQHIFTVKNKTNLLRLHIRDALGCVNLVSSNNINPAGLVVYYSNWPTLLCLPLPSTIFISTCNSSNYFGVVNKDI